MIISSSLLWERKPRWNYTAPSSTASWKLPVMGTLAYTWGGCFSEWLFSLSKPPSFLSQDKTSQGTTCANYPMSSFEYLDRDPCKEIVYILPLEQLRKWRYMLHIHHLSKSVFYYLHNWIYSHVKDVNSASSQF